MVTARTFGGMLALGTAVLLLNPVSASAFWPFCSKKADCSHAATGTAIAATEVDCCDASPVSACYSEHRSCCGFGLFHCIERRQVVRAATVKGYCRNGYWDYFMTGDDESKAKWIPLSYLTTKTPCGYGIPPPSPPGKPDRK
jgi:hypothetical protein